MKKDEKPNYVLNVTEKQRTDLTKTVYLVDGEDICFASKEAVVRYFNKLWNIHKSMTHTGQVSVSKEHTSTQGVKVYRYYCVGNSGIFTRRLLIDSDKQIEACIKFEYLSRGFGSKKTSVIKRPDKDYPQSDSALTVDVSSLGENESGWVITGKIVEDYFEWVNKFEAVHPRFGKVCGDFEVEVVADSEQAFADFYEKHKPKSWDYGDI